MTGEGKYNEMETLASRASEKGGQDHADASREGALVLGAACQARHPDPAQSVGRGHRKLLQSLGFEALATTSLGMSNALGRADGEAR